MTALDELSTVVIKSYVERAIGLVAPMIKQQLMNSGLTEDRQACAIVAAYTGSEWNDGDAILCEELIGKPVPEKIAIARSKAKLSHQHQKPTCDIPLTEREVGDTQYWGSGIAPHIGLVIAISGLQPWFDELGSWWIEAATVALMKHDGVIYRGPDWDTTQPAFLTQAYLEQLRADPATDSTDRIA